MGTDGPNLKETAKLYDMTEAEQELLLAQKRDHAMFMFGRKDFILALRYQNIKWNIRVEREVDRTIL